MSKKPAALYADDDYDDGYDDEWDDDYDEYEEPAQPDAAAAASKLAQSLCAASLQPGAQLQEQRYPVRPEHPQEFAFDGPSPDGIARASRRGNQAAAAASASQTPPPKPSPAAAKSTPTPSRSGAPKPSPAAPRSTPQSASTSAQGEAAPYRDIATYTADAKLRKALAQLEGSTGDAKPKPKLHVVVLGHVDAGKSTLMGRLVHDLGFVDPVKAAKNMREAEKAGRGSFGWAWVLDERPDERARGVTIDISLKSFETPRFVVTLLDAPGHRDFIPNMITGAAQADAAMLVVDGSRGGFESGFGNAASPGPGGSGQTREHIQVARSLGVQQLAVVITKLDTCEFAAERFIEVREALSPFLQSCGYRAGSVQWVPASAPLGQNITTGPGDARLAAWWPHDYTVADAVDKFEPVVRSLDKPLRLVVSDVYSARTLGGLACGGKVEAGALLKGGTALLLPARVTVTVKHLEVDGRAAQVAQAGDAVDLGLVGAEAHHLSVGSVLCHPQYPVHVCSSLQARIIVLQTQRPIIPGSAVMVHMHTTSSAGRIASISAQLDPRTGATLKANPRMLLKDQAAMVRLTLDQPLCMELPAACRALGTVVLRVSGSTIAVGKIEAVFE